MNEVFSQQEDRKVRHCPLKTNNYPQRFSIYGKFIFSKKIAGAFHCDVRVRIT